MTEDEVKAVSRINKREQFLKIIDKDTKKSKVRLEKYNQMLQKAIESNSIEAQELAKVGIAGEEKILKKYEEFKQQFIDKIEEDKKLIRKMYDMEVKID